MKKEKENLWDIVECPECNGKGMVKIVYQLEQEWDCCDMCNTTGKVTRADRNVWEHDQYGEKYY